MPIYIVLHYYDTGKSTPTSYVVKLSSDISMQLNFIMLKLLFYIVCIVRCISKVDCGNRQFLPGVCAWSISRIASVNLAHAFGMHCFITSRIILSVKSLNLCPCHLSKF